MVGTSGISNGEQIEKAGKKMFGSKFKGVFAVKGSKGVPALKQGEVAILNENTHWWAVINKHGKMYELDSYNIDHIPSIPDIKQPKCFVQRANETNCGPRSLTAAYFALKK